MTIIAYCYNNFNNIFKVLPPTLLIFIFIFGLLFNNYVSLFLTIGYIFTNLFNYLCKNYIFKLFCYITNTSCARPDNAKNCGSFDFDDNLSGIVPEPTTSGMPSGHAQTIAFVAMFLIIHIFKNVNYLSPRRKKLSYFLLIFFIVYMDFTRTYVFGCHTVLQVIVGNLISIFIAFFYYKLVEPYILKSLENVYSVPLIIDIVCE